MASIRIGIPPTCGGWNTGPPKVGQVPYPGSFCCAELLAGQGLHAVRPEVGQLQRPTGLWGLPPVLRPPLRGRCAGRASTSRLSSRPRPGDTGIPPPTACKQAAVAPQRDAFRDALARPDSVGRGSPGFAPNELLPDLSPSAPACPSKLVGPPTRALPWTRLAAARTGVQAPPQPRHPAACPALRASRLAAE